MRHLDNFCGSFLFGPSCIYDVVLWLQLKSHSPKKRRFFVTARVYLLSHLRDEQVSAYKSIYSGCTAHTDGQARGISLISLIAAALPGWLETTLHSVNGITYSVIAVIADACKRKRDICTVYYQTETAVRSLWRYVRSAPWLKRVKLNRQK